MKFDKSLAILAAAAALALLVVVGLAQLGTPPGNGVEPQGKALVGGHFTLTDHTGKRVTEQDFRGKYLLVYFGYTHCPEICPMSLQSIADAMQRLGPLANEVVPLFFTVDPERDGVKEMADYVSNFDPRTVGLTGSKEELAEASKAYRVYARKVVTDSAVDFDHSAIVFLMDRNGDYVTHFGYGVEGERMAEGIRKVLAEREPKLMSALEVKGGAKP
jgi:protein SCO1/2